MGQWCYRKPAWTRYPFHTVLQPYKYAGYPMLIKTIERETHDDNLFSKAAPILTAGSEVAFHTMNTSALNAEELRRENGIVVCTTHMLATDMQFSSAVVGICRPYKLRLLDV